MEFVALIMAGGKGERLNRNLEKPLLIVSGKPMIQRVLDALLTSPSIRKVAAATSPHTPKTREYLCSMKDIIIIDTKGIGYHEDMKLAVRELGAVNIFLISADLPLISPEIVEKTIHIYIRKKKPALTVIVPLTKFLNFGSKPTYVMKIRSKLYVPCGINVIDGSKINEPYIDEGFYISQDPSLCINVNTFQDLIVAEDMIRKKTIFQKFKNLQEKSDSDLRI